MRGRWRGDASLLSAAASCSDSPQLFERFLYGLALVASRRYRPLPESEGPPDCLVTADAGGGGSAWTCCDLICNRLGPIVGGDA